MEIAMKTLIVYTSQTGFTERYQRIICETDVRIVCQTGFGLLHFTTCCGTINISICCPAALQNGSVWTDLYCDGWIVTCREAQSV